MERQVSGWSKWRASASRERVRRQRERERGRERERQRERRERERETEIVSGSGRERGGGIRNPSASMRGASDFQQIAAAGAFTDC